VRLYQVPNDSFAEGAEDEDAEEEYGEYEEGGEADEEPEGEGF